MYEYFPLPPSRTGGAQRAAEVRARRGAWRSQRFDNLIAPPIRGVYIACSVEASNSTKQVSRPSFEFGPSFAFEIEFPSFEAAPSPSPPSLGETVSPRFHTSSFSVLLVAFSAARPGSRSLSNAQPIQPILGKVPRSTENRGRVKVKCRNRCGPPKCGLRNDTCF